MIWLGVRSKGLSSLVTFENETVDHNRSINEVLTVALKYGHDWTFQKDGAKPHFHGTPTIFLRLHWPPNSRDLNSLDYCL